MNVQISSGKDQHRNVNWNTAILGLHLGSVETKTQRMVSLLLGPIT